MARLLLGRDFQAVTVRAPALGRIAARRGEKRARERDLQRVEVAKRRHERLRGAEIEHGGDSAAQEGFGLRPHVARDGEVHVRVGEGRKKQLSARLERARLARRSRGDLDDARPFQRDRDVCLLPGAARAGDPQDGHRARLPAC